MNQPPGYPPHGNGPPGYGPPGYPPPPGGFSPQGPYRAPEAGPPKPTGGWVTPGLLLSVPGNIGWLIAVSFVCSTQTFRQNPVAVVLAALVPHVLFTSLFAAALSSARPQWSRPTRIVAGSFLTSGLAGWVGFIVTVLTVGLVAAACGGCRR